MSRKNKVSIYLGVLVAVALASFQNCAPKMSASNIPALTNLSSTQNTTATEINRQDENDTPGVEVHQQDENDTPRAADRCETGWVLIPGNSDLGTNDFCIMKFEAQNSVQNVFAIRERVPSEPLEPGWIVHPPFAKGTPESKFSTVGSIKIPWVYITQAEAATACGRIGAHLTSMSEAQTVSRNLFLQPLNWDSNQVGQGCRYGGHLDLNPRDVLGAPMSEGPITEHYAGTNDSVTSPPEKDMGKCFTRTRLENGVEKVHKNGWLSRRSLVLSSNNYIWDWSGNASEWIAMTCKNNSSAIGAAFIYSGKSNGSGYFDYNPADHKSSTEAGRPAPLYTEWTQFYLQDYESLVFGPKNPKVPGSELMDSSKGVGMYQGCAVNGNAIYRGGAAYHGPEGGIFQTHMDHTTKFNHPYIGFRCVKQPAY